MEIGRTLWQCHHGENAISRSRLFEVPLPYHYHFQAITTTFVSNRVLILNAPHNQPTPTQIILPFDLYRSYYEAGELVTNLGKTWRYKPWTDTFHCAH